MRIITIIVLLLILVTLPLKLSAETSTSEIDLSVSPHNFLFDLSNIKPGDSVSRVLTVANNGEQDFNYITSNKFLSGSEMLYEELLLKIEDTNGILFEGKLHEFNKLNARLLPRKTKEDLLFYIEIPYELGNEFQGLTTEFQFSLYVEGTMGGLIPVNGPTLPTTATNMFNFFLVGLLLVSSGVMLYFIQNRRKSSLNDAKRI